MNITPKKINRSLAFDLYPLLRREDWLDRFAGHAIYRETRCQELVEALWSHPASPWAQRINMLGEKPSELERGVPMVTQAAWVRSLMVSFVKEWKDEQQSGIGGLFGAARSENEVALPWNRAMQAAFLIHAGSQLKAAVQSYTSGWAKTLRKLKEPTLFPDDDPAFYGKYCLLATDQGIRGWLQVTNDLCSVLAEQLTLSTWTWENIYDLPESRTLAATDDGAVTLAQKSLSKHPCGKFLTEVATALAKYDWRTSSTPGLDDTERVQRAAFRGSGGYKELRLQLLLHLQKSSGNVGAGAKIVLRKLGYK